MRNVYLVFLAITLAIVVALPRTGQCQKTGNVSRSNPAYVEGELLVQFKPGSTGNDKAGAYRWVSAEEVEVVVSAKNRSDGHGDLVLIRHTSDYSHQAAVNAFSSDPSVEFAEPNWIYTHQATSDDTYYTSGQLWGMYGASTSPSNKWGSNAAAAWADNKTGSKQVYVGIIDEGIQYNHKDLKGQVWTNPYDTADGVDNDGNGIYMAGISSAMTKQSMMAARREKRMIMGRTSQELSEASGGMDRALLALIGMLPLFPPSSLDPRAAQLLAPPRRLITLPILRPGMG